MKSIKAGDKVYWNQKDKSVILAVIGKEPVHEGIKIVGSHIDSPRLDLKANPVHEQDGIVYFRTHYYGGIKKYQWTCIPLALIGVVFTKTVKSGYQYRTERQRPRFLCIRPAYPYGTGPDEKDSGGRDYRRTAPGCRGYPF